MAYASKQLIAGEIVMAPVVDGAWYAQCFDNGNHIGTGLIGQWDEADGQFYDDKNHEYPLDGFGDEDYLVKQN